MALIRSNFTKENMDLLRKNGVSRFIVKPLRPWDLLVLPADSHSETAPTHHAVISDVVDQGSITAMKFLFEMAGLYPANAELDSQDDANSLARVLLDRLGLPSHEQPETQTTEPVA